MPKSLYPAYIKEKENLIYLTPYNHYLAHKILKDLFPGPEMNLAYSFMAMAIKDNASITPEEYNEAVKL